MYLTVENGKRIDFIRNTIETWYQNEKLSEYEYYYLVSSLIEAIPFVSNITGIYGAFLKHWDKRDLNKLIIKNFSVINNIFNNNFYNLKYKILLKEKKLDIIYINIT